MNARADENDAELPNLEFLLFLGTFQDDSGNWQDPMEIEKSLTPNMQPDINDTAISEESGDE